MDLRNEPHSHHLLRYKKLLSQEDEEDLTRLWQTCGDLRARERLILSHSPLVYKMADEFAVKHTHCSSDDFFSEGMLALQKVIDRKGEKCFDSKIGRLSTFAIPNIKSAMCVYAKQSRIVKGPNRTTVLRMKRDLGGKNEQKAREAEKKIAQIPTVFISLGSASFNNSDPCDAAADFLMRNGEKINPHAEEDNLLARLENEKVLGYLHSIIDGLFPSERLVLECRLIKNKTLEETANDLISLKGKKLSRERVRQIEKRAIRKVRLRFLQRHGNLRHNCAVSELRTKC